MDRSRFDALTRSLAQPTATRRTALRAGIGALIAAIGVAGVSGSAEAATCRANGGICRKHGDCCEGFCGAADRTGRRRCGCTTDAECGVNTDCASYACVEGSCTEMLATGTEMCGDTCSQSCCYGVCCEAGLLCDEDTRSCRIETCFDISC